MGKYIYDEKNGFWYEKPGDFYLPRLELPEKEQKPVGIWRQRHCVISNSISVYFTLIC